MKKKLHVIVDSRESSVSFVRKLYAESTESGYDLGEVRHCREICFAETFQTIVKSLTRNDRLVIAMSYLSTEQLSRASQFLNALPAPAAVTVVSYPCFSYIPQWCRDNGLSFVANPYKRRTSPEGEGSGKEEAAGRIWVQFRLMRAIIVRSCDLSLICRNIILDLPEEGESLAEEYRRALRYYQLREPDMAGGTYPGEKPETNSIDTLRQRVSTVAATDFNVLIAGESGTGKETVAWAIHELSARKNRPFLVLNCAGLPEELLESELFGYKKGSHSAAYEDFPGLLQTANGGTLFLDELPDMTPRIQAKLLRFLEGGDYRPLGSRKTLYADIRIVAAGKAGCLERLRPDLLNRISQLSVHTSTLDEMEKEREGTLVKIAFILLERYTWTTILHNGTITELTPFDIKQFQQKLETEQFLTAFTSRDWHRSNIRELNNALRGWIVFGDNEILSFDDKKLPLFAGGGGIPLPGADACPSVDRAGKSQSTRTTGGRKTAGTFETRLPQTPLRHLFLNCSQGKCPVQPAA